MIILNDSTKLRLIHLIFHSWDRENYTEFEKINMIKEILA